MSLNIDTNTLDRRHLVMIVEDDKCIRAVLSDGLSGTFDTVKAADGQAALDLLAELPMPPDVIMTDVAMPRVDGFALAQRVRSDRRFADIPIIMVTANADREFKIKALDFGVDDFITKPFDLAEVKL